jgi:alpha-N-arabinofuranosidase
VPLKATLQVPSWRAGDVELPAVDASVARAADGSLRLALVNLDPQRPARVLTNLAGVARGRLLTAAAMDAHNTFAQPNALVPMPYAAGAEASALTLELPPKSIVVVTAAALK